MGESSNSLKVIVFHLGDEEYGVPVSNVGGIERLQHITRVPNAPTFVKGVINLRGIVTPIIDLRERFDMEEVPYTESSRIIVVNINEKEVGMIVDGANDVVDIPTDQIEPPPEVVGSVEADYIRGVAKLDKRLFILLDLEHVLSKENSKLDVIDS
ncbi:chemotaxis protein CheW [Bacillaceae bacterium W0354]